MKGITEAQISESTKETYTENIPDNLELFNYK